jgi:hypothetical protein
VLAQDDHQCFWYAGRLDRDPATSLCVPEAFFTHPENAWINERIWGRTARDPLVTWRIHALADYLKSTLYEFIRRHDLRILVLENVLTIPMHVPLGVALAELVSETHIPPSPTTTTSTGSARASRSTPSTTCSTWPSRRATTTCSTW